MHTNHPRWTSSVLPIVAAVTLLILPGTTLAQNQPPICDAGGPYFGLQDEPVQFDATASSDPDGSIVSYFWVFGDGGVATGPIVTHTFESAGILTVTLRVTDDAGASTSCNPETNIEAEIPDLSRDLSLEDYVDQVNDVLPELDPGIMVADPGPDWFRDMTIDRVAAAVVDEPPNTVLFEGDIWIAFDDPDSTSTRFVKMDFGRDYLRYIGQQRQFRYDSDPHEAVNENVASTVFWDVAGALGLPGEEMGEMLVDTVMETGFDPETGGVTDVEVERLVTLTRRINDYPVFGSRARIAVSNLGEPSRVQVKWRMFHLMEGLKPVDRPTVVQEIAERIWDAEMGARVEVHAELGYGWTPAGYVPVARVGVTDMDGALEGGLIEMVPIATSTTGVMPGASPRPMLSMRVWYSASTERAEIQFELPSSQEARITIYDATGRAVRRLAERHHLAGRHEIVWDGRNERSRLVPSGVYFVRLDAASGDLTQKIVVVR